MIKGTEDTRYAYVNGIVRAREARLLTRSLFDRLIAGTLTNFNTILSDTSYIGYNNIPAGLAMEEIEIKKFFKRYCITPEVLSFIDWPEQIHNLKVKLKQGSEDLMYLQQESKVETWHEVIEEIERFAVDKDPFILSTNLDKILCKYLYETAKFALFFDEYFQLYFDLENIRSFFRARQFENSQEIFNQVYISLGSFDKRFFIDNLNVDYEHLGKNFFTTPFVSIIEKGSAYIKEYHSFLKLERLCEEMRTGFLIQARKMTFGIEPLFTYYHFKISEIKKLRQVYWGKMNEVPVDELKESISDVW
jgi:vacuolar-type H+-ATPase subunit C/Vma6